VRLLLDTHALLWWLTGDTALSTSAQAVVADISNEVFVSAASARGAARPPSTRRRGEDWPFLKKASNVPI
jgi:hypothetical protein